MNTLLKVLNAIWGALAIFVLATHWSDSTPWVRVLLAGLSLTATYNLFLLRPGCRGLILLGAAPLNLLSVAVTARPWVMAMLDPANAWAQMSGYDLTLLERTAMGLGLLVPLIVLASYWRAMGRSLVRRTRLSIPTSQLPG